MTHEIIFLCLSVYRTSYQTFFRDMWFFLPRCRCSTKSKFSVSSLSSVVSLDSNGENRLFSETGWLKEELNPVLNSLGSWLGYIFNLRRFPRNVVFSPTDLLFLTICIFLVQIGLEHAMADSLILYHFDGLRTQAHIRALLQTHRTAVLNLPKSEFMSLYRSALEIK